MDRISPDTARRNEAGERRFDTLEDLRSFCDSISKGWFRCQALAIGSVSLHEDCDVVSACLDAASAAEHEPQIYSQVGCLAWPISALTMRRLITHAEDLASRAIGSLDQVTPASSRAEAALLLLQAVWPLDERLRRAVYQQLFETLASDQHWRVERACRDAVMMHPGSEPPAWLSSLLKSSADSKLVERIARDRAAGISKAIRTFVPLPDSGVIPDGDSLGQPTP